MEIKNGLVFCEDGKFRRKNIYTCGEFIAESPGDGKEGIDAAGCIVSPGFIDIHIHGAVGADFSDASTEACEAIAKYLASKGVTGFLGTTMARPESELCKMMTEACRFMDHPLQGHAVMYGINLEGPFACKEKKAPCGKICFVIRKFLLLIS